MAVVKATIKAALEVAFTAAKAETDPSTSDEKYADDLAQIIVDAITSGDVQFPIPVTVNPVSGVGGTTALGTIL